ncbi:hypothetical protein SERLA73DRAFT_145398 [Serpula lacrymans var. lacrymans S7.3]|uniref:Thioredoxin n=2 Tax=Serpula lacrymans var. lacrymans TaxID=341189 RepID=F8QDP4_SERL3|nr:uncharacterized protein SERLADRAFT_403328 [Serpula lacrymans var. lacrymans S7.9]EGN93715.1 hypothetical protein SERLA73DRAFT_145398 [Serpula lacrymans var. lacrymans S7.3]EGO19085.1 hypothetical protein SERLADRAFT_403328 [Serpula lacrymans var. lacrymans S7.9]
MTVTPLNSLKEFQEVINNGKVVIIDYWATWCGPCRVISPIFERLSDECKSDNVVFFKVDVDDQPDISSEVGIRAMPTFQVFKDGQKIGELVGANPPALAKLIESHV